ncbi:PilZ domain-containing protein [uncultured Litoreibacter sp.]|uniref:PilZ domain-containing protein n=1 Tax=uncultured Litoreibacter sp. TaxID=1392394 RepID=UPI0026396048|nr:PilZ domain-containing protein [uncultured Litoreibacter sp.]
MIALKILLGSLILIILWRLTRRSDLRHSCRIPVQVMCLNQCKLTHMADLGRQGCKIDVITIGEPGMHVELTFCGISVPAEIIWRNSQFAGLEFERRLSVQMLKNALAFEDHATLHKRI